jgi:5-methyltetrahydrofolate corrinoid/iron sulfur protein methyltransferase
MSADLRFVIDALKDGNLGTRGVINAATANQEHLKKYISTAISLNCELVVMLTKPGLLPSDAETTCLMAEEVMEEAENRGLPIDNLYLDPVLRPSFDPYAPNFASVSGIDHILESIILINNLRSRPVKTIVGLSNISLGQPYAKRSEYHCAVLPLMKQAGLSAAIMNVFDQRLMSKTIESSSHILPNLIVRYRDINNVIKGQVRRQEVN